jgi:predicted transcriptional regulator
MASERDTERVRVAIRKLTREGDAWAGFSLAARLETQFGFSRGELGQHLQRLEDRGLIARGWVGGKEVVVYTADR